MPFPINDRETLATIDQELVVGVTTRESLVNRLGQPDAMYEEGRLWVFADPDFENVLVYIDIAGNGNELARFKKTVLPDDTVEFFDVIGFRRKRP